MTVREVETELERQFSRMRKDFFGKGPLHTSVRIMGESIILKYKNDYTEAEDLFLRLLIESGNTEKLHEELWEQLKPIVYSIFGEVFPQLPLEVIHIDLTSSPDRKNAYHILILDKNLEKAIQSIK